MLKWNRLTHQYLVCPPHASVTQPWFSCAWSSSEHLSFSWGYYPTLPTRQPLIGLRVSRAFRCPLTLLSISSHRCSIGDKSGLYRGQSSGLMLWLARKSWQTLATWGWALSCWKIRWCCCTNGTATGWRISSLFLTPVKLLAITINSDFNSWDIPPQTISEPPLNLSLSRTQASAKRSPRPSGRKRVNCDSSVKKTCLHYLIGNCLGPCTANQAIRRTWRARVRGKPM